MDRIIITDMRARCIVGVNKDERTEKQDVTINISIYADLRKPGRSDKFEDAIDYRAIKKRVLSLVENSQYFLLEALTEAVADACLETPGVIKVHVRVDKPSALRFAKSVGVEISRLRGGKDGANVHSSGIQHQPGGKFKNRSSSIGQA
jgi:D-erythro-7,8-dihydroneopterin triphosphate epimerase